VTPDRALGLAIVTIASADAPGLLARIAGGLAAAGADVVAAEIHSLAGGAVLDVFRVADPHARFTTARGSAALAERVARAVAGEPLPEHPPGEFSARAALPPVPPQVAPTNDAASDHSVLDVVTGDRPGLLRDIARFFHDAGVSVDLAFVTTEGRVARDTFYVVDRAGSKVDDARLGALAAALERELGAA
jgi:[protein-PII] uridylyltransferase